MRDYCFRTLVSAMLIAGIPFAAGGQPKSTDTNKAQETIITVGLSNADIVGPDNRAIQAAVDLVYHMGSGTVRILPGEYVLNDAIRLWSNIHITGDREKTILKHAPLVSSPLLVDADIGQKEVTPRDPSLFKVGMGIICQDNTLVNDMVTKPLTVTRIEHGVLYLNGYIEFDFTADFEGKGEAALVTNVFPLIYGYEIENTTIEGLTIDSKVDNDAEWKEIRTGGLCLDQTKNCVVRNVKSVNNYGDGFLIISSEHTTLEDCEGAYNSHHGIHPGSHSPWTIVRRCVMHHNGSDGLYICWGVRESEFTDNIVYQNGLRMDRNGISIGHKDTDNLIAGNHVYENAKHGIHFRVKTEPNGAHHNKIIDNVIENNGLAGFAEKGCGIYIAGITHDILIENNTIRETRQGDERLQTNAVLLEPGVTKVQMINNTISGHPGIAILDNSKSPDNKLQKISSP